MNQAADLLALKGKGLSPTGSRPCTAWCFWVSDIRHSEVSVRLDVKPRMRRKGVIDDEIGALASTLAQRRSRPSAGSIEPPQIQRTVHPCAFVSPTRIGPVSARPKYRACRELGVVAFPALMT